MYKNYKCTAIILAGGKGLRAAQNIPKQFLRIGDMPMFLYSLKTFQACELIDRIVLVLNPQFFDMGLHAIEGNQIDKLAAIAPGGDSRNESVYNGLLSIEARNCIALVHDAARPFVHINDIERVIEAAYVHQAAILATPVTSTIKLVDNDMMINKTLPRESLYAAQTPQAFKADLLKSAHQKALLENLAFTDDASLLEYTGISPKIVTGSADNIKITTAEDLHYASFKLKSEGVFI